MNMTELDLVEEILHELELKDRQRKHFKGCLIGSPNPANLSRKSMLDPSWDVDEWMEKCYRVEIQRSLDHDRARLQHIHRIRGFNC